MHLMSQKYGTLDTAQGHAVLLRVLFCIGHSSEAYVCWSQLTCLRCVGHSSEVYAVLVTAQRPICWSQFRGISCVGHSLEVYAVLVTA